MNTNKLKNLLSSTQAVLEDLAITKQLDNEIEDIYCALLGYEPNTSGVLREVTLLLENEVRDIHWHIGELTQTIAKTETYLQELRNLIE